MWDGMSGRMDGSMKQSTRRRVCARTRVCVCVCVCGSYVQPIQILLHMKTCVPNVAHLALPVHCLCIDLSVSCVQTWVQTSMRQGQAIRVTRCTGDIGPTRG